MVRILWSVLLLSGVSAVQYCSAGPTLTQDSCLGLVTLKGDSGAIDEPKKCPSPTGIEDLTASKIHVSKGKTYTLSWGADTCGLPYARTGKVFVDWTAQGWNSGAAYQPEGEHTGDDSWRVETQLIVPADAVDGPIRLRIVISESSDAGSVTPCSTFTYGAAADIELVLGGGGMSGGSIFLLIVFIGLLLYLIVGFALGYRAGKRGLEAFPNREGWINFLDLVKEGCGYTKARLRSLRGGGNSVEPI